MAPQKKKRRLKSYSEEIGFKKEPRELGPISMRDVCSSCQVDDKKLVREIMMISHTNTNNHVSQAEEAAAAGGVVVDVVKSMKLDAKNIARVLPGRITEVKFFPTSDMRMLVVGNNFGDVGFWNIDNNDSDSDSDGIYMYHPHSGLVSGISIHPYSITKIISSCYNGFVRVLDVETESFNVAYYNSEDAVFSICRPCDNDNSLFIGEGYGGHVGRLDLRSSNSSSWSLHREKIYTIDFNSHNTNLMATASKDGTACIWDVRRLDRGLHPQPLIKLLNHNRTVNSAYFSPLGNLVATTSMDNTIGVLSGPNYELQSMIYHSNDTPRFLSSFRGIWGWDECSIMVGNKKKGVDIISVQDKRISYTLSNREINAIPCRFDAHQTLPGLLAVSTAGGRVFVWDMI